MGLWFGLIFTAGFLSTLTRTDELATRELLCLSLHHLRDRPDGCMLMTIRTSCSEDWSPTLRTYPQTIPRGTRIYEEFS